MAKFCTKCGRALVEGEICSCSSNASEQGATPMNNMGSDLAGNVSSELGNQYNYGSNMQPTANKTLENTKNIVIDTWKIFLNVLKRPFNTSKEYVMVEDNMSAILLIFIQAILNGLLVLTVISRLFSELLGGLKNIATSAVDVNSFGNFMVGFLTSAGLSFVYALILFALCAIMFKANLSFMVCLRAIAIRSVAMITVTALAIILSLMSAKIGIIVGVIIAPIVGFMFVLSAIRNIVNISEDRLVYFMLIFVVVSLVAYYFIAIKLGFYNIPLIRSVKNGFSNITSLLGNAKTSMDSLSGLFK